MAKTPIQFESFSDPDCTSSSGDTWESEESPEGLEMEQSNQYNSTEPIGGFPKTTFSAQKPDRLKLTLSIKEKDTKKLESSDLKSVLKSGDLSKHIGESSEDQIKSLKNVIWKYDGSNHQPPFVKIIYGDFLFKGICKDFA